MLKTRRRKWHIRSRVRPHSSTSYIPLIRILFFSIEKVSETAASTKEAVIAGEKIAEEKLAAAKETVKGLLDPVHLNSSR